MTVDEFKTLSSRLIKEDEQLNNFLTYDKLPPELKKNISRNITIGVTFVKKDGSIRHMAFRRFLKAYDRTTNVKTEKQTNIAINNNMMNVYDTNEYIRLLKETGDEKIASKSSYRFIKFESIFAFLCGGNLYDMREINKIKERFGDEIYDELSPNMKLILQKDIIETDSNIK